MELVQITTNSGKIRGLLSRARPSSSEHIVFFIPGFERTVIEPKFKILEQALRGKVNIFRFDFPGLGLSDGDFETFTIKKAADNLAEVVSSLLDLVDFKRVSFVAHSLGACIVSQYLLGNNLSALKKIVFLAPALNQKELFRLWFVSVSYPAKEILWGNFRDFLDEDKFNESLKERKEMKAHYLNPDYFLENKERDFNKLIKDTPWFDKIFVVHGDADEKVPIASNAKDPNIIVKNGNHNLEKPSIQKQWPDKTVSYLLG